MRHIPPLPLSPKARAYLAKCTSEVLKANPGVMKDVADRRWETAKRTNTFREVRDTLHRMNGPAVTHCMYCEYNEGPHIDHFEPRASDPAKTFDWDNMNLACSLCDSNHKRDRFLRPLDGVRPLSPRADVPQLHLRLLPSGAIRSLTNRGAWTVELFGLDRETVAQARADRWTVLRTMIPAYSSRKLICANSAASVADVIRRGHFRSVLQELVAVALGPKADVFGLLEVRQAIQRCPEIAQWGRR